MYIIRHDASGEIRSQSYDYSADAYTACINRVMESCETHSVLWTAGESHAILDGDGRDTGKRAVQCERMVTMSGADAFLCDITEEQWEHVREYAATYRGVSL